MVVAEFGWGCSGLGLGAPLQAWAGLGSLFFIILFASISLNAPRWAKQAPVPRHPWLPAAVLGQRVGRRSKIKEE